jgi:hypothetical protein
MPTVRKLLIANAFVELRKSLFCGVFIQAIRWEISNNALSRSFGQKTWNM